MESNPPGGDPGHVHHAGCGCAEEAKKQDPFGQDLFDLIDISGVQCFNERKPGMGKNVIRPIENKLDFSKGPLKSGYGKDMVLVIPFTCEVRVKCICLIGGDEGEAPITLKLYKNEEAVDVNIQEEKKCV